MPVKHFLIDKKTNKKILRLPVRIQDKILSSFDKMQKNPLLGIKLEGELSNYYKFRLGDYRIIYRFDSKKSLVIIVKIEHRQGVYK